MVSDSSREWVVGHLRRLGLDAKFAVVVCGEDVELRKPAPDGYLAAAATLRALPRRTVAVEDTPRGVRAAKAAGLRCLAVPGPVTTALDLREADAVADGFDGLGRVEVSALVDSQAGPRWGGAEAERPIGEAHLPDSAF